MWWDLLLFIDHSEGQTIAMTSYQNVEVNPIYFIRNYSLPAAIDPPVSRAESFQAGSRFVLICNIFLPTGVTVSGVPSVEWRRPSGGSATEQKFLRR